VRPRPCTPSLRHSGPYQSQRAQPAARRTCVARPGTVPPGSRAPLPRHTPAPPAPDAARPRALALQRRGAGEALQGHHVPQVRAQLCAAAACAACRGPPAATRARRAGRTSTTPRRSLPPAALPLPPRAAPPARCSSVEVFWERVAKTVKRDDVPPIITTVSERSPVSCPGFHALRVAHTRGSPSTLRSWVCF